jgi:hypothetical protein
MVEMRTREVEERSEACTERGYGQQECQERWQDSSRD